MWILYCTCVTVFYFREIWMNNIWQLLWICVMIMWQKCVKLVINYLANVSISLLSEFTNNNAKKITSMENFQLFWKFAIAVLGVASSNPRCRLTLVLKKSFPANFSVFLLFRTAWIARGKFLLIVIFNATTRAQCFQWSLFVIKSMFVLFKS